jgi:DNA-binding MarR family transcriptional regulator
VVSDRPAIDDSIGHLIDHAVDLTARFLSDRADLTASAAYVMNRLNREGPMRLTTLAAKEGVSQPSMTQLVQRLERQELVTRIADPDDGRVALIGITDAGVALFDERLAVRRERLGRILTTLDDEDRDALALAARVALPVLQRLVATAEGCADAACGGDERKGRA